MEKIDEAGAAKYQQISHKGHIYKGGWRRSEPCPYIDWEGMRGKTVLDLGSNNGMMSIQALEAGASRVVGVEIDESIHYARRVRDALGLEIEFWHADLNNVEFLQMCSKFDIVLCCSIFDYMKHKPRFLLFLDRITKETAYVETNHQTLSKPVYQHIRTYTTFSAKELGYSGNSPDTKHVGHFMIKCWHNQQWGDWPEVMIPIDLLKLSHDLDGYKNIERYSLGTYTTVLDHVTGLANDIEIYGLNQAIWVKKLVTGDGAGMYRVIEGHNRTFALRILRERGRIHDVPCKVFPNVSYKWIRTNGLKLEDYTKIFEIETAESA